MQYAANVFLISVDADGTGKEEKKRNFLRFSVLMLTYLNKYLIFHPTIEYQYKLY